MEELEGGVLRRSAGLVDSAGQARSAQSLRSDHRPERGVPGDGDPKHVERGAGDEDRGGVRAELEEASANRAGHTGPLARIDADAHQLSWMSTARSLLWASTSPDSRRSHT